MRVRESEDIWRYRAEQAAKFEGSAREWCLQNNVTARMPPGILNPPCTCCISLHFLCGSAALLGQSEPPEQLPFSSANYLGLTTQGSVCRPFMAQMRVTQVRTCRLFAD